MKEQDVRQRIESFLKRTARELIIPASAGLSLCDFGPLNGVCFDAQGNPAQSGCTIECTKNCKMPF
jgi:hypothetical protein